MAAPALDSFADDLYEQLSPLTYADPDNGYALAWFAATIGSLFQPVEDLVRDDSAIPGWGKLLDVDFAPTDALPWLGQLIGVAVDTSLPDPTQRDQIRHPQGFQRGTRAAMIAAGQQHLTGTQTLYLKERAGGDAYHILATSLTDETPDPDVVEAALLAEKPAGLTLTYQVVDGQTWQQLIDTYPTWADAIAAYPTWQDVIDNTP